MCRPFLNTLRLVIIAALFLLQVGFVGLAFAQEPTPTTTDDPLVEPLLPPNPTIFELGRNLYWHWCMTCHGDRGQGLTDDWRAVWEEDHQNCWARGCHAGSNNGEVFVIPTVVPLIIGEAHLVQFTSLQSLSDFLKLTHPPQHPGVLTDEEYHAIAAYVFTQNDRSLATSTPTPEPTLTPSIMASNTPVPTPAMIDLQTPPAAYPWTAIVFAIITLFVFAWLLHKGRDLKN